MKTVLEVLAGTGAGLLVGFLLGSLVQYRSACAHCVDRRMEEVLEG